MLVESLQVGNNSHQAQYKYQNLLDYICATSYEIFFFFTLFLLGFCFSRNRTDFQRLLEQLNFYHIMLFRSISSERLRVSWNNCECKKSMERTAASL